MKKIIMILSFLIIITVGFLIVKKDQSDSTTDVMKNNNSTTDVLENTEYSAKDILANADFNVEKQTITVHTIDTDKKDIFTRIEIPEETQKKLIQAFQNAKFAKTTIDPIEYDYRITISLNTGYTMYLISDKKSLHIVNNRENYAIVNDSDFFSILVNATK
ncbi:MULTISPECIES: hypothetical protein [Lysinibacillus]|uniref:Uncharacterized protein n=1 Tax=Lysinibacillus irui TaxID=2998077 RepID=A0AAJ5UYA8_9BACI|nr:MULTISPECIES: hypothetical protein [Lysinibacillus]WDV08800.1 hypothetical protein OU989_10115 [Lysinibacillus irui]